MMAWREQRGEPVSPWSTISSITTGSTFSVGLLKKIDGSGNGEQVYNVFSKNAQNSRL